MTKLNHKNAQKHNRRVFVALSLCLLVPIILSAINHNVLAVISIATLCYSLGVYNFVSKNSNFLLAKNKYFDAGVLFLIATLILCFAFLVYAIPNVPIL